MKQQIKKWKTYSFDELFDFDGGMGIPRDQLGDVGIPYLHYGDMHTSSKDFIDLDSEIGKKLPRYDIQTSGKSQLNEGDLVFVDASEDYEGTCKTFLIKNIKNQPFISGLHTFIAREKNKVVSNDFKKYITRIPQVKSQIFKLVQGYKVYGINRDNLKLITVDLPEFDESQKIADVLTTWDNAVELQEKKIEKLQEKKKALMQTLLTPKPDWKDYVMSNLILKEEKTNLQSSQGLDSGLYPFYINNSDESTKYSNTYLFDGEYLIANTGGQAYFSYIKGKFTAMSDCFVFSIKEQNAKFVYYVLQNQIDKINLLGFTGSGLKHLDKKWFYKLKLLLPKNEIQENTAKILTAFDQKIDIENQLLEKYKEQRKALTQLLLTGIVRV